MKVLLFGGEVSEIEGEVSRHKGLDVVSTAPDVVVCYGGDGTLLRAERQWPGIPKAPIRNSQRGNRCIAHPAAAVLARLAAGQLAHTDYLKLECALRQAAPSAPERTVVAMNEVNVHMGRINSAVRFRMWIDDEPYEQGREILGDGFIISTPFGSTAYFNHITRGYFHAGLGVAFKSTSEHTNHVVLAEDAVIRILITRGPGVLTYDNSSEYLDLDRGCELTIRKHAQSATLLTWAPMKYPSDQF